MNRVKAFKNYYLRAFLLSILIATVIVMPFIIKGKGILYIVSDFDTEHIPFNILANDSIRSGNILWNWNTDLGSNFIGAYSTFIGSPFFWLSMIFPARWFPYINGPLMILKIGLAGLFSYSYIKTYVKNENYATIGSLLYAFSGFQICNMVFGSFQEVIAVFPLLLLALDKNVQKNRKGYFALAVAICALMSYFFFVGEVVFLCIYFVIKVICKEYRVTLKKVAILAWESLLGVGLSCALLIPSVLFTMQNPRTQSRLAFNLWSLIYYPDKYLNILKGFLLPSEAMVKRSIFIPVDFVSCEAYLPLFGIVLALIYCLSKKKDFLSVAIFTCTVITLVPVLNSSFYLLNSTYYARWYYMFILLLALASSKVLEEEKANYKRGIIAYIFIILLFIFGIFLWSKVLKITTFYNVEYLLLYTLMALTGASLSIWLLKNKTKTWFSGTTIAAIIAFSCASGIINIYISQTVYPQPGTLTKIFTNVDEYVKLPEEKSYRLDTTNCIDNTSIILSRPTIQAFNTTVNGSIFEFYNSIGINRIVKSEPPSSLYGLRPFLSVKYIIALNDNYGISSLVANDVSKIPDITLFNHTDDYTIYKSDDYLPFGYTFDKYISKQRFSQINIDKRHLVLLKAIVLDEKQANEYKGILDEISDEELNNFSIDAYRKDVADRRSESSYYFDRYNNGFTAKINLKKENFVFFSVPFDKGWKAEVNGKQVEVEKVDSGFMAVKAAEGENTIKFTFIPEGLKAGFIITGISLLLLLIYMYMLRRYKKCEPVKKNEDQC